jgi:hypothetical protein
MAAITNTPGVGSGPEALGSQWTLLWLAASAGAGSIGMAAGGTAGSLLAVELTGVRAAAGLPLAFVTAGAILSAILVSVRSATAGRRSGLLVGYALGSMGAGLVVAGAALGWFVLVLAGCFVFGMVNPAISLTRYAGAAVTADVSKGRGLGLVMVAGTLGAVLGPNVLGPTSHVAVGLGLPGAAGPFVLAVPALGLAALNLQLAARTEHGRILRQPDASPDRDRLRRDVIRKAVGLPTVRRAIALLVVANAVMVAVMAVIPVHLAMHGHQLELIGLIVSVHVLAMFAPSAVTGTLADRIGGYAVGAFGIGILAFGALAVWSASSSRPETMMVAVALLGLGWNLGIVGASSLLAVVPTTVRAASEGLGETAQGVSAWAGALMASFGIGLAGMPAVSLGCALAGAALLAVWYLANRRRGREPRQLREERSPRQSPRSPR